MLLMPANDLDMDACDPPIVTRVTFPAVEGGSRQIFRGLTVLDVGATADVLDEGKGSFLVTAAALGAGAFLVELFVALEVLETATAAVVLRGTKLRFDPDRTGDRFTPCNPCPMGGNSSIMAASGFVVCLSVGIASSSSSELLRFNL